MTAVLGDVSEVTAPVFVISGVSLSGPLYSGDNVVAYTDQLFNMAEDCMAILHRTCWQATTEVTFEGVVTYSCDEGTTYCGLCVGNTTGKSSVPKQEAYFPPPEVGGFV